MNCCLWLVRLGWQHGADMGRVESVVSWSSCWQLHGNLKAGAGEVAGVLNCCCAEGVAVMGGSEHGEGARKGRGLEKLQPSTWELKGWRA